MNNQKLNDALDKLSKLENDLKLQCEFVSEVSKLLLSLQASEPEPQKVSKDEDIPTIEEIRALLTQKSKSMSHSSLQQILFKAGGAKTLSDTPEERYADIKLALT